MAPPPGSSIPLLRVKMSPPSPGPAILRRERLVERLRRNLDSPDLHGTLVLAGAGYGKTTLIADFLRTAGVDSVWYALDPSDRDPHLFFRYIIEGIREHGAEFGALAEPLLDDLPSISGGVERFVDVLINDAAESLSGRIVLVLDDFHHLEGSETILRAVRRLLDYLPDLMHVILISRSVPDLEVSRLKSRGILDVLERGELLFSLEETRQLVTDVLGTPMAPAAIRDLQERTQGWVTALQLLRQGGAGLAEGAAAGDAAIFDRTEPEIFEYFSEGVLAKETDEVQRFMRRSSLPTLLEPEICARVLPDLPVRGLLESILRRNLFIVPLAGRADAYTYHPLFREFLARKLIRTEGEAAARDLHLRYARCFEERGEMAAALHHYVRGSDAAALSSLLQREGRRLLDHGLIETVRGACDALRTLQPPTAPIDLLMGEIHRIAGDYTAALACFRRGLGSVEVTPRTSAEALQGLAYVELKLGDLAGALSHATEALSAAGEDDPLLRARVLNTIALAEYRSGRYEAAMTGWRSALDLARRGGDTGLLRKVAHNLGLPHAMRGEYDKALDYFRMLMVPAEGSDTSLGPGYAVASLNVARIEILRGQHREAAGHLDDSLEITHKYRLKALRADVLEAQGTLLRETGDPAGARQRYAEARGIFTELGLEDLASNLDEEEATLLLAAGSAAESLRLAEEVLRARRQEEPAPERLAPALLLAGRVRLAAGDAAGAAAALEEARRLYGDLSFRYQLAEADLMLARARLRSGGRTDASLLAAEAVDLVETFGYRHMARRLAASDPKLRDLLAGLPAAAALVEPPDGARAPAPDEATPPLGGALGGYDLTINMLGPVEVYRDELRKIPASAWTLKRALRILCYLAAARDRRATKDRIVDTFWGDANPAIIMKNFHPTISYLRKALNFSHAVNKNFILFEKGSYRLNPQYRYRLDIEAFEKAVTAARGRARAGDAAGALASFGEALGLYRGDFLEEEYDEWIEAPRSHYAALLASALEDAGDLFLATGRMEEALGCFERLSRLDPLSEEASCRLMLAHGAMGNRAGVEREYTRLAAELKREMDLEPLPETRAVYERALGGGSPPTPPDGRRPRARPAGR